MTDRRSDIVAELEKGLDASISFFTSLSPEELKAQVYQDTPFWTVRQVLAHFVTIEGSMHRLFRNILSGGPGSPEDFDLDRFNLTQPRKLDGLTLNELVDRFRAVRKETISIVEGMSEKDLDRTGRHVFHGQGTLERFIRWAPEHNRIHEDDVRKALAG
jgi:uncharacterized damage-inducible protein DinB